MDRSWQNLVNEHRGTDTVPHVGRCAPGSGALRPWIARSAPGLRGVAIDQMVE